MAKIIVYGCCSHRKGPEARKQSHLGTYGLFNIKPSIHLSSTIMEPTVAMCNVCAGRAFDDGGTKSEYECNIREQEVKNELKLPQSVFFFVCGRPLGLPQACNCLIIAFELHVFEKKKTKERTLGVNLGFRSRFTPVRRC